MLRRSTILWLSISIFMLASPAFASSLVPCGPKSVRTGNILGVTGTDINIRLGPGTNYEKIVNQKATNIFKKTMYAHVDNSVTVREICRQGDWSRIDVIEPDWLRESHRGWVASRFLRRYEKDATGKRVFTENDFIWDKNIRPYKKVIIAGVNKIYRENSRCKKIDPTSAYLSGSRSKPGKPVFFVTCNEGPEAFNVWFSEQDLGD